MVSLTWLGHASFRLDSEAGRRIYVDPWLRENPACPQAEWMPERVDIVAVTHGHFDHIGDVVSIANRFAPAVVAQYEVAAWLKTQGVDIPDDRPGMGKGGTLTVDGVSFTMTHAVHSSGIATATGVAYGGDAAGYVIRFEDDLRIYFAGDTAVFSDMALIRDLYRPDVAVLPIGDYLTMGPREAAAALRLLGTPRCIPCHFGTIPLLSGTPDALRDLAPDVEVLDVSVGVPTTL